MNLANSVEIEQSIKRTPAPVKLALRERYLALVDSGNEAIEGVSFWRFVLLYEAYLDGKSADEISQALSMPEAVITNLTNEIVQGVLSGF